MHASSTFVGTAEAIRPVRRIQIVPISFWTLFLVQGMVVLLLLLAAVRMLPAVQPLAAAPDYSRVRDAVMLRTTGATVDPLIEFQPGATAPASSVRGFALNGVTYYYQMSGTRNFDPLSRNLVSPRDINVVLRDTDGPNTLIIYTLAR